MEASVAAGFAGVHLSSGLLAPSVGPTLIRSFFRERLQFGGLLLARVAERSQMDDWLAADVDAFVVKPAQVKSLMNFLRAAYRKGDLSEARLNDKVRRLLLARQWCKPKPDSIEASPETPSLEAALYSSKSAEELPVLAPSAYFSAPDWVYWKERVTASSMVLAANPEQRVPLRSATPIALYEQPDVPWSTAFRQTLNRYASVRRITSVRALQPAETLVAVLRDTELDSTFAQQLLRQAQQQPVVLVNLGQPGNLALLDTSLTVIQAFGAGDLEQSYAAQLLMGGRGASGRLPATFGAHFRVGQGLDTEAVRLGYTSAYQAGIAPQRLVGIDAIVESAIDEKAFPGAQLLVAKDGKVIYRKSFGHHTYAQEQPVRLEDYYDLASITKVAATTLAAMQAYEQEEIELNDRLREHLQLRRSSRLRNLRVEKLLSHRTGLQPHLPVIPYLLERDADNADCERYFCVSPSADFPIAVSDSFYFARKYYDRIWDDMQGLRSRYTRYRYSDVNFVLLQRLLEAKAGTRLDSLVDQSFYQPLGLQHFTFLPLQSVPPRQIVPTENDYRWRHQLVHGYVHDETAALLGGVAGHAGLFGNADDLAVVFQMLLNGGTYGQRRFFEPQTIEQFTTASHGNHRGLGFDKPKPEDIGEAAFPEGVSRATFGHTGFTGTCVWSDPDQQLTYIFLSNRIHPDRNNKKLFELRVRERVHEVVYSALGSYEVGWPQIAADE
jgi:CubicO group peptidase (beta-lactamase class C family)